MSDFAPTSEQQEIVDLIRSSTDNVLVNALAGTGKTTTLDLVQAASPKKPVLCIAFNKRVAEEAEKRFPGTTTVRTFNGLGHRIWAKTCGNVTLDPRKCQTFLRELISHFSGDDRKNAWDAYWEIIGGVSMAKSIGYVPEGKFPAAKRLIERQTFHLALEEKPSPLVQSLIDAILIQSIQSAYKGFIDYNDQIYMPALFGGIYPNFPHVMIDEYQDLNPTNHVMVEKLAKQRLTAVGDPNQCIYGFRGAVTNGMSQAKTKFKMTEQSLTISFRCPSEIVKYVQWRVPQFKAAKQGGSVVALDHLDPQSIPDHAAILCRNNAPLFSMAFRLLGAKRSVQVAGSDIGPRLIKILGKIGADDDTQADLIFKIDAWEEEKLQKSNSPASVRDSAACLRIFASFGKTKAQALAYADHLFKQQGSIKLMTGHKAKGLEWPVVYHLDPWLVGTCEQEQNLRYVISTRSSDKLYEIESGAIRW